MMENERIDRINKILEHDFYKENVRLNEEAETEREFCRHDMSHFLDVARIAEILNLREGQHLEKDWIYAAALLHDIGRHVQYKDGTPHEEASAGLAAPILADCGFDDKETSVILKAIASHRKVQSSSEPGLDGVLYRADKLSRSCFACKAEKECNWKNDKKNMRLVW
jgi:uncharacterized protein